MEASRAERTSPTGPVITVLLVVAILYFARSVLIPLTLAILLAFLLGPLVARLRHWGLGRILSAMLVVALAFSALGVLGTILTTQLADLARRLPGYQMNIDHKLQSIRTSGGWLVSKVSTAVNSVSDVFAPAPAQAPARAGEQAPMPVEIRKARFDPVQFAQQVIGSVLNVLLTGAIVVVFVIFMLIEREDLRDRLFGLTGARRVQMTTNLLDDATRRVSRYLLAQLLVNAIFGVLIGIGLTVLKIPNPLLWGILTALLRYIPYLGVWIAAILPALVAFAVKPGWTDLPLIALMYFVTDMLMYNLVEPLLYGSSTGITPLAILVAAVFWTWLWGPVGLLLATPLTVCVVVIGRHVPNLGFLNVMLSDEEVLAPETRLYQRLLARDLDEAAEIVEEYSEDKPLEELYDGLMVPVIRLAEEDRHRGRFERERFGFVLEHAALLCEVAGEASGPIQVADLEEAKQKAPPGTKAGAVCPQVACIPARDEADEVAATMLAQLFEKRGVSARRLSSTSLAGEQLAELSRHEPEVACVVAVPPFGYMHVRYLCRRIGNELPGVRVVAMVLADCDLAQLRERQPPLVADELACHLADGVNKAVSLLKVVKAAAEPPVEPGKSPAPFERVP